MFGILIKDKKDMRRVLFVHEGPLYRDRNNNYYGVHFTDAIRQRYLQLGSHVTFLMRVLEIEESDTDRLSAIDSEGFGVISVPNFKAPSLFIRNYWTARKIIENAVNDHDVVVVRMPSAISGIAASFAFRTRKPILAEFVGCTFDAYWNYSWQGKLIAHYKRAVQRRLLRRMSHIVYVTKFFLQRRYPSDAKQIYCSNVEIEETDADVLEVRLRNINELSDKPSLTIGTVAALDVPYKGQKDVVRAVWRLKKMGFRFKYLLVGQGDPASLDTMIKSADVEDCVEIIGPLKHSEVFSFYDRIDLYIQPSRQEGLPRALIEAMSRGCPCLGADTAGIPELLEPECIFKAGDVSGIVEKLLVWDRERLLEQSKRNFREALNYRKNILEERRKRFFSEFLKDYNLG